MDIFDISAKGAKGCRSVEEEDVARGKLVIGSEADVSISQATALRILNDRDDDIKAPDLNTRVNLARANMILPGCVSNVEVSAFTASLIREDVADILDMPDREPPKLFTLD